MPYLAVQWLETPANPTMEPFINGPHLVRKQGNNLIWMGGGWMPWPDNAEIVKVYPFRNAEKAELAFLRDRPMPSTAVKRYQGWLSPEGKFYPCEYAGHSGLARRLTAHLFNSLDGEELIETTWLRIHYDGYTSVWCLRELTQAQRDTLFDLATAEGSDDVWSMNIMRVLRAAD